MKMRMQKMVLVNILTILRIPLSILFCAVLYLSNKPFLLCYVLFFIIAATDFWDGKLARYFGVQTRFGAMLDVVSDFFFILTAIGSLYHLGILPLWMIAVISFKVVEFWITSYLLVGKKSNQVFRFDKIGKAAAILCYILPVGVLFLWTTFPDLVFRRLINIICILIFLMIVISSVQRIRMTCNFFNESRN